jgi:hypothetical protein
VPPTVLLTMVGRAFGDQPGVRERLTRLAGTPGAVPDHGFHVFVVYPWVGLLGAAGDVPRSVLDSCRVRWGTVVAVDGDHALVRSAPLTWRPPVLALGAEELVRCRWRQDGRAFVAGPEPGDQVSMHWNWLCERLHPGQVERLRVRTRRQLRLTNSWLAGRHPAAAAGPVSDLPATLSG